MQDVQRQRQSLPEIAIPDRRSIARSDLLVGVLLVVTMLVGGYFRFTGLNWDDFTHLHPDERFLTDVAQGIGHDLNPSGNDADALAQVQECIRRYPDTAGAGPYFDTLCSTLNPLNANRSTGLYVYGTLPLFIARGGAELWAKGSEFIAHNILAQRNPVYANYDGSWWATYDGVQLVWRFLSMLSEMIIIVVVFVIGTKLHDKWVGLLAAFFYSVTVFSIQMAHFGTVDSIANLFSALTILFAVLVQRQGKLVNYALFGFFFGCSMASRINLIPLAALIPVAALLQVLPLLDRHTAPGERRNALLFHAFGLILAAFVSLLAFRVFNPYAFNGPGFFGLSLNARWLDNMSYAQSLNAGVVDSPPNFQWVNRIPYIFPLDNMVLWGMGVPLGIIAWVSWAWAGVRALRGKPGGLNNLLLVVWVLIYFGWLGRNWVTTMRYFLPIYPVMMVLAAWGLVALVRAARNHVWRRRAARLLLYATAVIALLWSGMFTNIYRHLLTRVAATDWVWEHVPADFAMQFDGQPDAPLIQIPLPNNNYGGTPDDLPSKVTRINTSINEQTTTFTAPVSGTVTSIHAPHLASLDPNAGAQILHFSITREGESTPLTTATLNAPLPSDAQNIVGQSYDIPLDTPLTVVRGDRYNFNIDLETSSTILSGGSIFTWEGAWDDPVPVGVCALPLGTTVEDNPPSGLLMDKRDCKQYLDPWYAFVNGYEQDVVYEDEPSKRDHLLLTLDHSDYIAISSNRFYDTLSRNPMRWPLTNLYYQKLFAGQLGYDLVATFQQTFELGPLRVSDQYLPTYSGPKWLNEFESEEAFSVYDHPVVFIFKKSASYDPQAVHDLFYSVPLTRANDSPVYLNCPGVTSYYCDPTIVNVATLSSDQAAKAPTDLQFTQPMRDEQYDNGTWSDRFDQNSIVNQNQPLAVVVWWMTVLVFGFAAFPLLFVLLPGLADRGYGLAKFAGMFIAGWGTWYLASLRVPVWSQIGIAVALGILFLLGMALLWRRREEFVTYLRAHWKRLALIELITLLAFLAFVVVRLSNPDLWNPSFGGEKPMDFAYFNGVLRSTIFPPIDPWYAGGYINYYYFGFVIVGTPVLLLKMFPSIAYNLILPTLFALTGIAAFSVAFNVVHALRDRMAQATESGGVVTRARRLGNPWLAGIAALLLAVVMGNLDTPRVFLSGVARAGGYTQPSGMQDYLIQKYKDDNGGATPNQDAMALIMTEAATPSLSDKISYEAHNSVELLSSLGSGLSLMFKGQENYISPERWFWGPTRILAETPGVEGNAINEMPIFTYVYGDMHAHMISMPMQLGVMGLILNEILLAGSSKRKRWPMIAAAALIGLYVGMLRATNTWDWITFLVLSGVGLVFAWWLGVEGKRSFWRHFTRRSLLDLALYAGTFLAVMVIASIPYTEWFSTTYNRVLPWTDGKTPLWAYFDIHGLFLFLTISLLVWETGRWLRSVYVRALRGLWLGLMIALLVVVALLVTAIVLSLASYQVTLVVLPLLVWIAILFFRRDQSRVMQFVLILTGLALGLTLGVEYVVLDGDIGRQNTVFKFYIQAWLLLSVVGGAAFAWLIAGLNRWNGLLRGVWTFVLVLLVGVASLFPIMATRGKAAFRFDPETCAPVTLDGMDYMKCAKQYEGNSDIMAANPGLVPFPLDQDYAMIRWLQENVKGTPTIMEGLSEDPQYHWDSRISIYTGLPAVVGWNWHQRQQRTLEPFGRIVETRNANVNAFYQTQSIGTAWDMIQYYHVSYVIVGGLERAYYQAAGLAKFDQMVTLGLLKPVFTVGTSTIYQVNPDAKLAEQG